MLTFLNKWSMVHMHGEGSIWIMGQVTLLVEPLTFLNLL